MRPKGRTTKYGLINESRATRESLRGSLFGTAGSASAGEWRNKLIWGDNKLVAGSLLQHFAGRVNLIYIDPPFDTGTDFSFQVRVGDAHWTKEPSIIEEHAWSRRRWLRPTPKIQWATSPLPHAQIRARAVFSPT